MKRAFSYIAALAGCAMMASSATGGQSSEPVYNIYYYNNAGHQEQVGFARGTCTWYGVGADLEWGTYSNYPEQELVAYCENGIWQPL